MLIRKNTTEAVPVKIVEERGTYAAQAQSGAYFDVREMPVFLKPVLRDLELLAEREQSGFVWGFLSTKGTELDGYYRFDKDAVSFRKMFKKLRGRLGKSAMERFNELPWRERARFISGSNRLTFGVYTADLCGAYIAVLGSTEQEIAPLAVVKQKAMDHSELSYAQRS